MGDVNLDPADGDGRAQALTDLLDGPRLIDPAPVSAGAAAAGDPTDTTDWATNKSARKNLRVDYVLPSTDLSLAGSGVLWPVANDPLAASVATASAHRLVWVDVILP